MIRLLDKKLILADKNAQTRTQIEEGVQLAHKVDKLRQELADLERQRELFIKGSKGELEKALGNLQIKKSALESELVRLEGLRKEALKPLDAEWAEVKAKMLALNKEWEQFTLKKDELQEKTKANEEDTKQIESSKRIAADEERTARRLNREAQEREAKSKELEATAIKNERESRERINKEDKRLTLREREANGMANALDKREKALVKREGLINDRERRVNDKYETLQRTINRLKK